MAPRTDRTTRIPSGVYEPCSERVRICQLQKYWQLKIGVDVGEAPPLDRQPPPVVPVASGIRTSIFDKGFEVEDRGVPSSPSASLFGLQSHLDEY